MKWFKFNAIIALFAVAALVFTACDSSTDPDDDENPQISNITPSSVEKGDQITITGVYFGATQGDGYVLIDDYPVSSVDQWSNTQILVTVPNVNDINMGDITVYVMAEDDDGELHTSNAWTLTIGQSITVEPVTMLRATSLDNNAIQIKWAPSASESNENFSGYDIYVKDSGGAKMLNGSVDKGISEYTISQYNSNNLIPGEIYTMTVKAKVGSTESDGAEIMWAPAMRFEGVKIYSSSSTDFGSGLQFYDETTMQPVVHMKSNSPLWNIGLYTGDGTVTIGSASELGYSPYPSGDPASAEMGTTFFTETDDLDWVFMHDAMNGLDSEGDQIDYMEMAVDLENTDYFTDQTQGAVLLFRSVDGSNHNYAKVLIKNDGSGWLQGTAPNQYIEVDISYQVVPNVPYAK